MDKKAGKVTDFLTTPILGTKPWVAGTPAGEALARGAKGVVEKVKGLVGGGAPPLQPRKTLEAVRAARLAGWKTTTASADAFFDELAKVAGMRIEYGLDFRPVRSQTHDETLADILRHDGSFMVPSSLRKHGLAGFTDELEKIAVGAPAGMGARF